MIIKITEAVTFSLPEEFRDATLFREKNPEFREELSTRNVMFIRERTYFGLKEEDGDA